MIMIDYSNCDMTIDELSTQSNVSKEELITDIAKKYNKSVIEVNNWIKIGKGNIKVAIDILEGLSKYKRNDEKVESEVHDNKFENAKEGVINWSKYLNHDQNGVSDETKKIAEMSNKKLTIEYPVNGDLLDNDAKALIDREFVSIAKQFSGARVRIEGNTDNTGNAAYNVELSKRRAQSVANYLIKEYGFDTNRFIIVGNGPKKAVEDGVSGSNQSYRTTDFQLVNE